MEMISIFCLSECYSCHQMGSELKYLDFFLDSKNSHFALATMLRVFGMRCANFGQILQKAEYRHRRISNSNSIGRQSNMSTINQLIIWTIWTFRRTELKCAETQRKNAWNSGEKHSKNIMADSWGPNCSVMYLKCIHCQFARYFCVIVTVRLAAMHCSHSAPLQLAFSPWFFCFNDNCTRFPLPLPIQWK